MGDSFSGFAFSIAFLLEGFSPVAPLGGALRLLGGILSIVFR
jgi:hypothetical protein